MMALNIIKSRIKRWLPNPSSDSGTASENRVLKYRLDYWGSDLGNSNFKPRQINKSATAREETPFPFILRLYNFTEMLR